MSTWYASFFASPSAGTTHSNQPATNIPPGTLVAIDAIVAYDWPVTAGATGTFVRNAQAGFGLSWVPHGNSRPSLTSGGGDNTWLYWGGIQSGNTRSAYIVSSSFSNVGLQLDRETLQIRWRGARNIGQTHDWWAQTSVNFLSTPDNSGVGTWWVRLTYW